jgi:hypothetical protein
MPAVTVAELDTGGDQQVTASPCYYFGATLQDLGGDASIQVFKGDAATQANGIDCVGCSDEVQADRSWYGPHGIYCPNGFYVNLTGTVDLACCYYIPMPKSSGTGQL